MKDAKKNSAPRQTLTRYSRFLDNWLTRNPASYSRLLESGVLNDAAADPVIDPPDPDTADFGNALRVYRNTVLATIAWRDLADIDKLESNLASLSNLAERCLEAGLCHAEMQVAERHGEMRDENGKPVRLIMIGMGKLGGGELNFSSDIDLIFSHRATPETASDGKRPLDAAAYLKQVARRLIKLLSENTAYGFVYRVDTRLRPFGDSGALVAGMGALENYYQAHGREWERYAWVKARPVAGDMDGGRQLIKTLRPFVYRRYLDYGTFESIRDMKALIDRQVVRAELQDNIKLGSGGIREIEFVVQAFQLIRGGQEPLLQGNRLLPVLRRLADHGHLAIATAQKLENAYRFLRRTENRLQMWADQQTHDLPETEEQRQTLAESMGYPDEPAFAQAMFVTRQAVQSIFEAVFITQQVDAATPGTDQSQQLYALWEGELDAEETDRLLQGYGLTDARAIQSAIEDLKDQGRYRSLQDRGRRWLMRLVPPLFATAGQTDNPDQAMTRTLAVVASIIGRSTYVALLVEYPDVLATLMRLCAASPWITDLIRQQPGLLDTLLKPGRLYRPADRRILEQSLGDELQALPDQDLERKMDLLRRFAHREMLRVAAADVSEAMPLMVVSDHLTDLAEVVLQAALDMAWQQMAGRYGLPRKQNGECEDFCVVGYGKLGGLELGYGSDLDLVFLYDGSREQLTDGQRQLSHHAFFTRLAQRVGHVLSIRTPAGRAYEVDPRLRPSGDSGQMVTHIDAFETYQQQRAWTWEHQALVRARAVAGSVRLGERFDEIRTEVLARQRDPGVLAREVQSMRQRMRDNLDCSHAELLDVKQMPGGLIDIEFMAQFVALRYGHECRELLMFSDTIRILETLESAGIAAYASTRVLVSTYRAYRRRIHKQALQEQRAMMHETQLTERRATVRQLWQQWIAATAV